MRITVKGFMVKCFSVLVAAVLGFGTFFASWFSLVYLIKRIILKTDQLHDLQLLLTTIVASTVSFALSFGVLWWLDRKFKTSRLTRPVDETGNAPESTVKNKGRP